MRLLNDEMPNSLPRVLFVSYTADWTGPTNSLLLLLRHLRARYDVAVLLPGEGTFSERLAQEGVSCFSFSSLGKEAIPAIFRLVQRNRFDLVYGNSKHGSSRNAFIAAKLARVPFICHMREMGWDKSWRQLGFLRFADAVIAVSDACAASVSRFVATGKLYVVHNGITTTSFEMGRVAAREALLAKTGLSADSIAIVNVGHVCPRKGQEYAIRAMAAIVDDMPSAHLLVVGSLDRDPDYTAAIRSLAGELGLDHSVSLLGFRQDVLELIQGADLFLHTSVKDPHPRVILEAMAVGLPVVAFSVDGVAETVDDGQTGYLVASEDVAGMTEAALKLISDPELCTGMGKAGRLRVETCFSAEATAKQVGAIIDATLQKHGRLYQ